MQLCCVGGDALKGIEEQWNADPLNPAVALTLDGEAGCVMIAIRRIGTLAQVFPL